MQCNTVSELITYLSKFPGDMPVEWADPGESTGHFGVDVDEEEYSNYLIAHRPYNKGDEIIDTGLHDIDDVYIKYGPTNGEFHAKYAIITHLMKPNGKNYLCFT